MVAKIWALVFFTALALVITAEVVMASVLADSPSATDAEYEQNKASNQSSTSEKIAAVGKPISINKTAASGKPSNNRQAAGSPDQLKAWNFYQVGPDEFIFEHYFWNVVSKGMDHHADSPPESVPWKTFDMYATRVEAVNDYWNKIHHILVKVNAPPGRKTLSTMMWTWLRMTPGVDYGNDTGYLVPGNSTINANWHFARAFRVKSTVRGEETPRVRIHLQKRRPKNLAAFLDLDFGAGTIPPGKQTVVRDHGPECMIAGNPKAKLIGVLLHAHAMSYEMNFHKYSKQENKYQLIARVNPMWPQPFWPVTHKEVAMLSPGDYLRTQCLYKSIGYNKNVSQGRGIKDEMCANYVLYSVPYDTTAGVEVPEGISCNRGPSLPKHPFSTGQKVPPIKQDAQLYAIGRALNKKAYGNIIQVLKKRGITR